jgi:hypothetical protein
MSAPTLITRPPAIACPKPPPPSPAVAKAARVRYPRPRKRYRMTILLTEDEALALKAYATRVQHDNPVSRVAFWIIRKKLVEDPSTSTISYFDQRSSLNDHVNARIDCSRKK